MKKKSKSGDSMDGWEAGFAEWYAGELLRHDRAGHDVRPVDWRNTKYGGMKSFKKYSQDLSERDLPPFHITLGGLSYHPVKKLRRKYSLWRGLSTSFDLGKMPKMTWAVAPIQMQVVTYTQDGKETQNTAAPNDIVMSGPTGERYVVRAAKFPKLYTRGAGDTVTPDQTPKQVAVYTGQQTISFKAPWGEMMILKPGDYVVKDGDGYYRIAKTEFELTYNRVPNK